MARASRDGRIDCWAGRGKQKASGLARSGNGLLAGWASRLASLAPARPGCAQANGLVMSSGL